MRKTKKVIRILRDDFIKAIEKQDVCLVFTKNKKIWVCEKNGIKTDGDFMLLTLASSEVRK